jgi:hypothetical protein
MNEFKHIFSEHLTDLATAVKMGERFQKTPYTVAREFTINFNIPSHLGRYLLDCLEKKEIYLFLLNY